MDIKEATEKFAEKYGVSESGHDSYEFLKMMYQNVQMISSNWNAFGYKRRPRRSEIVKDSYERMTHLIDNAHKEKLNVGSFRELASFVAEHSQPYVWSILFGKNLKGGES